MRLDNIYIDKLSLLCENDANGLVPRGLSRDIHWIIPDFTKGSGGHATIFRIIRMLGKKGHKNHVWLMDSTRNGSLIEAKQRIREWFFSDIELTLGVLVPEAACFVKCDIVVATSYSTAYFARAVKNVYRKLYLIQDFEPYFFPKSSMYFIAENTYRFALRPIAASSWLAKKMLDYGHRQVSYFDLAVDHSIYKPEKIASNGIRIAFYSRASTGRRLVEIGMLALYQLHVLYNVDFIVDLFGMDHTSVDAPFKYFVHGILSPNQLAELYNSATIGICFSATNYSLIPAEMMACGLPVLDIRNESTEGIYPNGTVFMEYPDAKLIAAKLNDIISSEELRREASKNGINYTQGLDWQSACDVFEKEIA